MALALRGDASDDGARPGRLRRLLATRPTAVNLRWALDEMMPRPEAPAAASATPPPTPSAAAICDEDVAICRAIGEHGLRLIREIAGAQAHGRPVEHPHPLQRRLARHVDWGTATAPIYQAHDAGIPVHVWVDETRPRNQGAALTAWELAQHGVPHTVIADNAGGHLMQRGMVDLVHRRHRPHHAQRRRLQQDRHLPQGAGGARQRRAVLRRAAVADDRLAAARRAPTSRSRSATPTRSLRCTGATATAAIDAVRIAPSRQPAARTPPST